MKSRTYNDYDKFFTWLFDKPVFMVYETDIPLKNNKYSNEDAIIYYPLEIEKILKTQAMSRMGKILQLGTKIYNMPKVHHTRLEHSKGTYFRSLNTIMTLCENEAWKNVFEKNDNKKWLIAKIVNDLLHDIGHGPFSHTMEAVCELPKGFHEDIGRRLILENHELKDTLNSIYPNLNELILEFQEKNPFGLASTSEGQVDVDRGDFLPRDEYFLNISDKNKSIEDVDCFFDSYTMEIVTESNGNKLIRPIYKQENLENILRFLENRFYNYKNFYYNVNCQKYDYVMKSFAERLLQSKEKSKLKSFLENNVRSTPQRVNLDEYIEWTDVSFLKAIADTIKSTDDEILKKLGLICIPGTESVESLLEGTYISKVQEEKTLSKADIETIETLTDISKFVDKRKQNLESENLLILNSISKQDIKECKEKIDSIIGIATEKEKENGVISWEDRIAAYKRKKGEEIYIRTNKGNAKEITEFVSERHNIYAQNLLGLSESINGLMIILPILNEKNKEILPQIKNVMEEYNVKNSDIQK